MHDRQHRRREGGRSEVECRKTVVFVLSIRANEQVQLHVCVHVCVPVKVCVCVSMYCMIIAIQCILKQLEESSLSFSPSHLAPWACSDLVCPESISQLILLMLHMSNFTNTTRSNQLLYRLWLLCCCVRRDITNASQWQSFNYFWPSSTFWGL